MEESQVLAAELDRGLQKWESLPSELLRALEHHCENLAGLVSSLRAAGRDHDEIRALVGELLRSYEADLVAVLESGQ